MHKIFSVILTLFIILMLLPSCSKSNQQIITGKEAKEIITAHHSDAIILECIYSESTNSYVVDFKTFHGNYEGTVNARTGSITSIILKEEPSDAPMFDPEDEENSQEHFIPAESAIQIALQDSEAEGTAVLIKNELDKENKVYNVIFRSGNSEYTYKIDAITGKIISFDVVIDS